jgi:predicted lipid carrier protein YhbT
VKLLQLLPEAPPAHVLALALNAGICFGLVSRSALEPLLGKTVSLEASDLGTRVRVAYDGNLFKAYAGSAPTDLTIRSTVSGYLALALRREDPDTLFFTRRLVMTGDTELGLVVKNALDAIDWSRLPMPRSWKETGARR